MAWFVVILLGLILLAAVVYWALVVTEGAYLGSRVVTWLYDWGAASYDAVKDYDTGDEAYFLGQPLEKALSRVHQPLILDVATGTGRLPLALLRRLDFDGRIVALDRSQQMLRQARRKTSGYTGRVSLVLQDATCLPLKANCFDAVTCIEALEFLPNPDATLREMIRVLRPGGILVTTNRCGRDRWFFPGRAPRRAAFEARLAGLGLTDIETRPWQDYYDLLWARKPGPAPLTSCPPSSSRRGGRGSRERAGRRLAEVLVCPACAATNLNATATTFRCGACGRVYEWQDGILNLTHSTQYVAGGVHG
jgi:ubiquinone/menaquinone biosynthesis C-methylase UbiE